MKNVTIHSRQIFDHLEDAMHALGKALLDDQENIETFTVRTPDGRLVTGKDVIDWLYAARDQFEEKIRSSN